MLPREERANVARLGLKGAYKYPRGGYVGIDVSSKQLDVAILPTEEARQYTNDAEGIASIVDQLVPLEPRGVVLEATGGYETLVASELELAGLPVSLVNPRQVRSFAQAKGQLAKTDAIDAQVLALFAEAIGSSATTCRTGIRGRTIAMDTAPAAPWAAA